MQCLTALENDTVKIHSRINNVTVQAGGTPFPKEAQFNEAFLTTNEPMRRGWSVVQFKLVSDKPIESYKWKKGPQFQESELFKFLWSNQIFIREKVFDTLTVQTAGYLLNIHANKFTSYV
jgi:hypothetical protein